MGFTYKDSGVDVDAGNNFVRKIGPIVKSTFTERVITDIGGFGALFNGSFPDMKEPVLVSGTDGVGTKLKIAQMMDRHDTIGIDAVAMCVNDTLTSGARSLFFLDYISCGKLREEIMVAIVKGLAEGCTRAGCSLIGGETAEHPQVMDENEYDIAGFTVGVVDREKIINGSTITPGDILVGLPSSGIHSNGYSLVRKIFFDHKKYTVATRINDFSHSLGEELLVPTTIYCKPVQALIDQGYIIKGMVHITGGGFIENIPRILPPGCGVQIEKSSYPLPAIFNILQREGDVEEREMYTTFNMGIGMIMIVREKDVGTFMESLQAMGQTAYCLGKVVASNAHDVVLK